MKVAARAGLEGMQHGGGGRSIWALGVPCLLACSGGGAEPGTAGSLAGAPPGSAQPALAPGEAPTFYQHIGPIFAAKCVGCHQAGGVAPFVLDDYAVAAARGAQIADYTEQRIMPPYSMQTGGECGSFDERRALTPEQIALIGAWGRGERAEGVPVALAAPEPPSLDGALELALPEHTPEVAGSELAELDEYRCFLVDPGADELAFITGYEVRPGNAALVHHVLGFIVDPARVSRDGRTNAEVMAALQGAGEAPGREGWSCFGAAGEGVAVEGVPITWGPGQGAVAFAGGLGVPLAPGRQLVVQVHYNLADPLSRGQADQTRVRLRLEPSASRPAVFLLEDPLLGSLDGERPVLLAAGQPSVEYVWERTGAELGVPPGLEAELVSLLPHMHERGRKFTFELDSGSGYACQGHIPRWDFNWQQHYDYSSPLPFGAGSRVRVTCEYDTTGATEDVSPGWGTKNEMCLATLMLALPAGL